MSVTVLCHLRLVKSRFFEKKKLGIGKNTYLDDWKTVVQILLKFQCSEHMLSTKFQHKGKKILKAIMWLIALGFFHKSVLLHYKLVTIIYQHTVQHNLLLF